MKNCSFKVLQVLALKYTPLVNKSYFKDTLGEPLNLNMQVNFAKCASKFSTRMHVQYMTL